MGFRLQKRIKLTSGVRLNISKRGVGLSVGRRGARFSIGPSGRRASLGIPGTGIRYETRSSKGRRSRVESSRSTSSRSSAPLPPAVGQTGLPQVSFLGKLFKKPYEKEFIDGTRELFRQDFAKAYERYNQSYTLNNLCFDACLVLSMLSFKLGDSATAQNFLEYVLNSGVRKFPLIDQYLGPAVLHFEYPITENVRADFTLGVRAAYLMLAEIYQDQGRVEEAVDLLYGAMQQGYSDPLVKLSLVELLNDLERDEEIISLAQGTTNENNVSLATMFYLGQAMMRKGYNDAAIEILKSALAKRKDRDEQLLLEIRYLLARVYAESGRKAQAKKHYEQILAKDYGFRDVRERLESLRMDR